MIKTMTDDAQLLHSYVETRSQAAFAELVERHLALVYHTALRRLGGDSHHAEDAAQAVFILLSEKAPNLRNHPSLAGWLHATARFKAMEILREESRRKKREEVAQTMHEIVSASGSNEPWEQLRPLIDDVLLELNDADREAVLLRFFQKRSYSEIGQHLRLTEKSAHKRVERALEKLRVRLGRRGFSTTATLAAILGAQTSSAAPAGLAATVTCAATTSVATVTTSTLGLFQLMASTKTLIGITAVVVVATGSFFVHQLRASREAEARNASVTQQNEQLLARIDTAKPRLSQAESRRSQLEWDLAQQQVASSQVKVVELESAEPADGNALLVNHPELKAALLKKWREDILAERGRDFRALGLTAEQIEKVIDIELRHRSYLVGMHRFTLQTTPTTRHDYKEEMRAAIGRKQFDQYEKLEWARDEVSPAPGYAKNFTESLASVLYYTDHPLTAVQAAQIAQIFQMNYAEEGWPRVSETGWKALLTYARTSLPPEHGAALEDVYDKWRWEVAETKARRAYAHAQQSSAPAK